MPQVMAVLAVVFELAGGLMIIVGWKTRSVAWALVVYTIIATAVAHRFWTYEAAQAFNQTSHFFKNLSIVGGLLMLAAVGPGRYSVDKS
jgi:putative oxidoreductase